MSFLAGLVVLDLTTVVVGPSCTLRLAQYGASVVKVETAAGDMMRSLGGPSPDRRHSGAYLHLNADKRNACLNLRHAAGRAALLRLVERADVLVANMRPEALCRLSLDPATLRARQPALVHCVITGFGPGPYRGQPAYDSVVQGVSGVAGLFAARNGAPAYVPLLLADHVVGEIAAGAILAALVQRGRTGAGSAIEVPMHETVAAFVLQEHMGRQSFDPPLGPPGDSRTLHPGNAPIATSDGWISVTANTDTQAAAFLRAVGRDDALNDARFGSVADRMANVEAWFALRNGALRTNTSAHWLRTLAEADVPAMPCHSLDSLMTDPHLQAAGLLGEGTHPTLGRVRTIRPTVLRDGQPGPAGPPAAPIGWDTVPVLSEAGFSAAEIADLVASGAAIDGTGPPDRPA
jgi:crotonobetainyl-CoA:carnitine CoA-transferase CaiB-like acyl-CoA transferase